MTQTLPWVQKGETAYEQLRAVKCVRQEAGTMCSPESPACGSVPSGVHAPEGLVKRVCYLVEPEESCIEDQVVDRQSHWGCRTEKAS